MGSSLIKETKQLLHSEHYQWTVTTTGPFSTTLIDQYSKIEGEKFSIDYSLLQEQWPLYILRKNNPKHVVAVYDILQEREDTICAANREVSVVI